MTCYIIILFAARFFPLLKRFGSRELSLTVGYYFCTLYVRLYIISFFKFENDRNSFPDLNGALDNFAIIVTEDVKVCM